MISGTAGVDAATGLSRAEVAARVELGQVNVSHTGPSRSLVSIVRANVLTRFNAILATLLVVILLVGHVADALFGIVLVTNTLIGIVQELRAKWTLDRLTTLAAPRAHVVREGAGTDIAVEDVVLDDVLRLRPGDQVPVDATVLVSQRLEVDESLLTGESEPIDKPAGSDVLSGSFVVAGSASVQATRVGPESYANKLAAEARKFSLSKSELRNGINRILKYITWALLPTAVILLISQLGLHKDWHVAVTLSIAGVVGMIPEGLVLLTSIAFAVAVVRLGRRGVLVQELPAVEVLARVDVVCLDKTGTLTQGDIEFDDVKALAGGSGDEARAALGALAAAEENPNASLVAIRDACLPTPDTWERVTAVPFSSARKWSGADFGAHGTWLLGAPELLLDGAARETAGALAATGNRVLALVRTGASLTRENLPRGLRPVALVVLAERVRPDVRETLGYFTQQDVRLKIISGDNPRTVAAIAAEAGVEAAGEAVDARTLPDDVAALRPVMERHTVFGRVTPQQKRAMVHALQQDGHVVGMTGDGVNDILALKDADIGIAMGAGASATRAVAQLVLLQSSFATLPGVVAEGRRVIANVVRVANLFLTKSVYVFVLALAVGVVGVPFPFLPRNLTLVGSITIGIPAFFLSLAPNAERTHAGFVGRVLRFSMPAGAICAVATLVVYASARPGDVANPASARTAATVVLVACGLWVLGILARPLTGWRLLLLLAMIGLDVLAIALPYGRHFFLLTIPPVTVIISTVLVGAAACFALEIFWRLAHSWVDGGIRGAG